MRCQGFHAPSVNGCALGANDARPIFPETGCVSFPTNSRQIIMSLRRPYGRQSDKPVCELHRRRQSPVADRRRESTGSRWAWSPPPTPFLPSHPRTTRGALPGLARGLAATTGGLRRAPTGRVESEEFPSPGFVDAVVAVGDGVDTQRSPERIPPVPSVTAPISRLVLLPSDHRQRPLSVASPPFRLRRHWQRAIDGDGRESLVCRWILVPA